MAVNVSLLMNVASVALAAACVYLSPRYPIRSLIMSFACGMLVVISGQYSIKIIKETTKDDGELRDS
jgi:hypothetical protein